ncbi:protein MON2 homolog [Amyelois transitella]|uniref:protein MON2 homolog n=1 Tax=Amyelois transitella TaxID=680683 RepID=UPI00298FFB57|nr:protein MON2 homolog [Amyelois transitella]
MLEDVDSLGDVDNDTDPLAIVALLDRFQEVISKYTTDEDNAEPLPRHQLSEISFVLKALATLTESMKKAPPGKVDPAAWQKLIGVYPSLAALAAGARAAGAGGALRAALLQYAALLAAPPAPPAAPL